MPSEAGWRLDDRAPLMGYTVYGMPYSATTQFVCTAATPRVLHFSAFHYYSYNNVLRFIMVIIVLACFCAVTMLLLIASGVVFSIASVWLAFSNFNCMYCIRMGAV